MHEQRVAYFKQFGEVEARASQSPLYEVLCAEVARNAFLLDLAAETRNRQPEGNMLLGAVHYLLGDHPGHPLARFYPSYGGDERPGPAAAAAFADFCREFRPAIVELLQTRLVQTNEVLRSACLLPAFIEISLETGMPLDLIEIGPSAGLNLLFDRYRYDYGNGVVAGDPESPVVLVCDLRAGRLPDGGRLPRVASRAGIDLNPLETSNAQDMRWLRALIWPEHSERRELLERAIAHVAGDSPRLIRGDVFELLPPLVAEAPPGSAVTVVATFVLNQFTPEMRLQLRELLEELSERRDIYVVLMGVSKFIGRPLPSDGTVRVWLARVRAGHRNVRLIGRCQPHGRWLEIEEASPSEPWIESLP